MSEDVVVSVAKERLCAIPQDPTLFIGALGAAGKMRVYAEGTRNGAEVYGGVRNMGIFKESLGNRGFTHTGEYPEAARDVTPQGAEICLTHVYFGHVGKFRDLKPPHTSALLRDLRVANRSPPHA